MSALLNWRKFEDMFRRLLRILPLTIRMWKYKWLEAISWCDVAMYAIACLSLHTLGISSSSVIKASTRASGGYTPFTLAQESRRLCRNAESSGASSRSSSFNLSIRTESSWASSPLKQAPYFRQPMMVDSATLSYAQSKWSLVAAQEDMQMLLISWFNSAGI